MSDFKKLLVWQKAHALALTAHRIAARIRGTQNAALRSQITRAAQSVAANIPGYRFGAIRRRGGTGGGGSGSISCHSS